MFDQKTIDRFWAKVQIPSDKTQCWNWTACKEQRFGHGIIRINHKNIKTHRFSWELHYGKIPDNLCVLHHCDNPPCVNPNHLFLGTLLDNNKDRDRKNRQARGLRSGAYTHPERRAVGLRNGKYTHPEKTPRGERNGMSKLTKEQVIEIRKKYIPQKYSLSKLAKEFGTEKTTIAQIIKRLTWKHI